MLNCRPQLLNNRNLPVNTACYDPVINNDHGTFMEEIVGTLEGGQVTLPTNPGFETHPYKDILQNTEADKYIIGTFPPINYIVDHLNAQQLPVTHLRQPLPPNQVIECPAVPFFHGNVNGLWNVLLPRDNMAEFNQQRTISREQGRDFLINWLQMCNIYYDDIIRTTQRKPGQLPYHGNIGYTYEDKNLKNICPDTELIEKVIRNENLKVICFTNGATFSTNGLQFYTVGARAGLINTLKSDALSLFLRTCQELNMSVELRCPPHYEWTQMIGLTPAQRSRKLIFECRLKLVNHKTAAGISAFPDKVFTIITPFSPAAHGTIEYHPIITAYRQLHGNVTVIDILRNWYTCFRQNNWNELFQYNIHLLN